MKNQVTKKIETIDEYIKRGGSVQKVPAKIPKKYRKPKINKSRAA